MGDDVREKLDVMIEMNRSAIEASNRAIEDGKNRDKVTEMRFIHLEKYISELRDLHEDDMEKNSTTHKDFYREIGNIKEKLVDVAARRGFIERRRAGDELGGEAVVNGVLGKHALKGWGIIVSAILGGLGVKIFEALSK